MSYTAEQQEKIQTYIGDGSVKLYTYLAELRNINKLGNVQASVCAYVFALKKVMQNPDKYKVDDTVANHRELRPCEYTLVTSLLNQDINMSALRACCDFHSHNFNKLGM